MKRQWLVIMASLFVAVVCSASDIPLGNWPAPSTFESGGRFTSMADISQAVPFVAVTPCRIYDSRSASILTAGSTRNVPMSGGTCGLPAGAAAYSVQITAFGSAASAAYGFITAFPAGSTQPAISTFNFLGGSQTSSAAVVAAGGNAISVYSSMTTHFVVDINGYYSTNLQAGTRFVVNTDAPSLASILAINGSSAHSSHAIGGFASGGGVVHGVQGQTSNNALQGSSGVRGIGGTAEAGTFGVLGETVSIGSYSSGVRGVAGDGLPNLSGVGLVPSGVNGFSVSGTGIAGISQYIGAVGRVVNASGVFVAEGYLGYGAYGAYAAGNLGATGTKSFVEPHPTDASKVIRYVALEGPEAGTYFRGRTKTENGRAVIAVPESFRIVSDEENLTVQITPIGRYGPYFVDRVSLDTIEIVARGDLEFFYHVHGVRKAFRDFEAVADGAEFRPRSANDRMPEYLSDEAKRRLISNGTYNEDGSVNMSTATRLGWQEQWRQAERQ